MKGVRGSRFVLALVPLLLALSGCASIDRSVALTENIVVPITVGEAGAVPAHGLAAAMLRAGFTREEILAHGPAVRTALATSGGAQMRSGKTVEALFAIHSDKLYVTSRTRGTFTEPLGEYADLSF
jgi:hypothetical protein